MTKLIKNKEEIRRIRRSAKVLAGVLRRLSEEAKIGIPLLSLDKLAEELIVKKGAKPAFLGYEPAGAQFPFPYTLCTSLNEVVVHGRPSSILIKDGDILKLDLGVNLDGGISDAAITLAFGKVPGEVQQLIKVTKEALIAGVAEAKVGNRLGDIGYAIESVIKKNNLSIIEDLTGHGVGLELHEEPPVYNTGRRGEGLLLEEGMVLALEPMTALGSGKIAQLADDSFATADRSLTAHFEHTVLVTKRGGEILTI
ncbi:MAG: type I methionyl aminopeptidase [Candidatus Colwellbacteria bacterium]|nr:type I methionyl aminopeptidase [Candidatus Colwellbacteria bacterium]